MASWQGWVAGVRALALGLVFVASLASAQPPPRDAQDAEARGLFDAGNAAFEDGRFADALGYFQRAHELSGRPELLFNLAATLERLRRDAEAIAFYERYLAEIPTATNRRFVESRLALLRSTTTSGRPEGPTVLPEGTEPEPDATEVPPEPIDDRLTPTTAAQTVAPTSAVAQADPTTPAPARRRRRIALWTSVAGAVVAGAAVGLAVGLSRDDEPTLIRGDVGAGGIITTLVRR